MFVFTESTEQKKLEIMMKLIFVLVFALAGRFSYADLLRPYDPALHRIGYEVFVYVAGAIAGSTLVRYLAKKDWRMSKEWKSYACMEDVEAVEIERKVSEIRPGFRAAVRMVYDNVEGLLKAGWKSDLVLAALEMDDELMSRCNGLPIECLMNEAATEIKDKHAARLVSVLPDFKKVFEAAYDDAAAEWLRKDAEEKTKADAEQVRRMRFYNSFWGKVRQLISSEYRRRVKIESYLRFMNPNAGATRYRDDCWKDLCGSLVEEILKRDEDLRHRCQGVEKKALVESVIKEIPNIYTGTYKSENMITPYSRPAYIDDGEAVDIETKVTTLQKMRREQEDDSRFWTENGGLGSDGSQWVLCLNDGRDVVCRIGRPVIIGRSHTADVRVENADVSGRHIVMKLTPGGPQVKVLSPHGATVVDGKELVQGDVATVSDGSERSLGIRSSVKIVVKKVGKVPSSPESEITKEVSA